MIGATIKISGALLTGGALPAIDNFVTEAVYQVGAQGLADWHAGLDASLQHPTGHYESQLMLDVQSPDVVVLHDQGMVYGPWLEGTGSRNRTTKFKGYKQARLAAQGLGRKVPTVVAPYLELLVRRLNGGG